MRLSDECLGNLIAQLSNGQGCSAGELFLALGELSRKRLADNEHELKDDGSSTHAWKETVREIHDYVVSFLRSAGGPAETRDLAGEIQTMIEKRHKGYFNSPVDEE